MGINGMDDREHGGDPEETIEVEVERLDGFGEPEKEDQRWGPALGPVISGLIIDVLDFATFGGAGAIFGLLLGTPAGWYLARNLGFVYGARVLSKYSSLGCAARKRPR